MQDGGRWRLPKQGAAAGMHSTRPPPTCDVVAGRAGQEESGPHHVLRHSQPAWIRGRSGGRGVHQSACSGCGTSLQPALASTAAQECNAAAAPPTQPTCRDAPQDVFQPAAGANQVWGGDGGRMMDGALVGWGFKEH